MSDERETFKQAAALLERLIAHARGETEFSDEAVAVSVPAVLNMIYAALDKPIENLESAIYTELSRQMPHSNCNLDLIARRLAEVVSHERTVE